MYGIIYKAIEELVKANFGVEKWDLIIEKSGIEHDFFISDETYSDDIAFKLVTAIAEVTNKPIPEVLIAAGEWCLTKTIRDKHSDLLDLGGSTLQDFIKNLPYFHNRLVLIYPKLIPPEFKVSDVKENSLKLHYYSKRKGLREFVQGLLQGLSIMFETKATIEILETPAAVNTHEIFKISW